MRKWAIEYKGYSEKYRAEITFAGIMEGISAKDAIAKAKIKGLKNVTVVGRLIAEVALDGTVIDHDVVENN